MSNNNEELKRKVYETILILSGKVRPNQELVRGTLCTVPQIVFCTCMYHGASTPCMHVELYLRVFGHGASKDISSMVWARLAHGIIKER